MTNGKNPKDEKEPVLRVEEPGVPFVPKPAEEPMDRSEIRRKLMARFPKTLAYLAK